MADFVQKTVNKSALREITTPIDDVTEFNDIIEMVINDNPFECVSYTNRDGVLIAPVIRNREHYTGKVDFINEATGKRLGVVSFQAPSITALDAGAAAIMANTALATAMGGVAQRDNARESYYAQLKCHDPSGDDYYVTFTRKTVRISSYQDDAIRSTIETRADAIPALM